MRCGCDAVQLGDKPSVEVRNGPELAVHRPNNDPYPSCYRVIGETLVWVKR